MTFGHVEKRFDEKVKVNFKIYDVTTYFTNNCNMHIDRYLKNSRDQTTKFDQLIEYNMRTIFLEKSYTKNVTEKLFSDSFRKN